MNQEQIRAKILDIGIIPAVRVSTPEDAWFAAEAVSKGGIPIVELTMTVPRATELIAHLVAEHPKLIVGAGTVLDAETAGRCLDAGAHFITSPGLDPGTVRYVVQRNALVVPGVLTPSEIMIAVKEGANFVKVFPCAHVGGPAYIRSLRAPFPGISFVASGGINQQSVAEYVYAGVGAIGVGADLIPPRAIKGREQGWIVELARRFSHLVRNARSEIAVNV